MVYNSLQLKEFFILLSLYLMLDDHGRNHTTNAGDPHNSDDGTIEIQNAPSRIVDSSRCVQLVSTQPHSVFVMVQWYTMRYIYLAPLYLLFRLNETNPTSIPLVYDTYFVGFFVTKDVKVMIDVVKREDCLLNRDWLTQVETKSIPYIIFAKREMST